MDFSELFTHSNHKQCHWSPNGAYLATIVKYRLVIRDAETLQIVQIFSCLDVIHRIFEVLLYALFSILLLLVALITLWYVSVGEVNAALILRCCAQLFVMHFQCRLLIEFGCILAQILSGRVIHNTFFV